MIRGALSLLLVALLAAEPAAARTLAVINARAWTVAAAQPIDNATILIEGDRIVSVTSGGTAPAGAEIVDAGGRDVTPTLFAAATQIGLVEVAGAEDTADASLESGKLGAAFDVAPAINGNSLLIERARADGVGWALSFPGGSASPPFQGQAALLRLSGGEALHRARAAMFASIGGSSASASGGSRAAQWTLLRAALDQAKLVAAGTTVAAEDRIFGLLDLNALGAVAKREMPLALQVHRQSDIAQAIRLAADYQLKVVIVGGAEAWTLADRLARADIAVILDPGANLPLSYDEIGARPDNAAILDRAGVTLGIYCSAHTIDQSYNVGPCIRMAAGLAVASGLPRPAALAALTLGPARIWEAHGRTGSIEAGKSADLVVWDGDPLEPTSAPVHVILAGKRIELRTRQDELAEKYAPPSARDGRAH